MSVFAVPGNCHRRRATLVELLVKKQVKNVSQIVLVLSRKDEEERGKDSSVLRGLTLSKGGFDRNVRNGQKDRTVRTS